MIRNKTKRFIVVDTNVEVGTKCPILGHFDTQEEVDIFIQSLPDYLSGRYGVDDICDDEYENTETEQAWNILRENIESLPVYYEIDQVRKNKVKDAFDIVFEAWREEKYVAERLARSLRLALESKVND